MIGDINSRYSISSISNHLAVWHFILLTGNSFLVRFYKDHSTSSCAFHTLKNIAWHDANTFEHLRKADNFRPFPKFSWLAAGENNWFPFVGCIKLVAAGWTGILLAFASHPLTYIGTIQIKSQWPLQVCMNISQSHIRVSHKWKKNCRSPISSSLDVYWICTFLTAHLIVNLCHVCLFFCGI